MYFQPSTTALAIIALAPLAACEGINCEGSGACSFVAPGLQEIANSLQSFPNAGFYPTGAQIACYGSICAFFQNGANGGTGDALFHVNNLLAHGCSNCGSDPTQPGNNVDTGELTVNYVSSPTCNGVCDPPPG